MRLGIVDLVSLLGSLIFAIPVANFGVTKLLAGETIFGIALVAVAVAMVLIPHYLLDPRAIVTRLLAGVVPARLRSTTTADSEHQPNDESNSQRDR